MNIKRISFTHNFKLFFKVTALVLCYMFFTLYTVPTYKNIRAYADNKIFLNKNYVVIDGSEIFVEIADTEEKRIQGLSGREKLNEDTGMLFIFDMADTYGIWMKDMKFDIDIIWFDTEGKILHIVEKATPESYPQVFSPSQKSQYVLEVPAGFVKEKGLSVGDAIDLK